jgi:hypothetical protein
LHRRSSACREQAIGNAELYCGLLAKQPYEALA